MRPNRINVNENWSVVRVAPAPLFQLSTYTYQISASPLLQLLQDHSLKLRPFQLDLALLILFSSINSSFALFHSELEVFDCDIAVGTVSADLETLLKIFLISS